jgi:hypothetical protein
MRFEKRHRPVSAQESVFAVDGMPNEQAIEQSPEQGVGIE